MNYIILSSAVKILIFIQHKTKIMKYYTPLPFTHEYKLYNDNLSNLWSNCSLGKYRNGIGIFHCIKITAASLLNRRPFNLFEHKVNNQNYLLFYAFPLKNGERRNFYPHLFNTNNGQPTKTPDFSSYNFFNY